MQNKTKILTGLRHKENRLEGIDTCLLEYAAGLKTGHSMLVDVWSSLPYCDLSRTDFTQQLESSLVALVIPNTQNDILLSLMGLSKTIDNIILKAYKGNKKTNFETFLP